MSCCDWFVCNFLIFLGLGFYATPSIDTAISSAYKDKVGIASGIPKMAISLGGSFGVAISAWIYSASIAWDQCVTIGVALELWFNVVFCLLCFISILVLVLILVSNNAGKNK